MYKMKNNLAVKAHWLSNWLMNKHLLFGSFTCPDPASRMLETEEAADMWVPDPWLCINRYQQTWTYRNHMKSIDHYSSTNHYLVCSGTAIISSHILLIYRPLNKPHKHFLKCIIKIKFWKEQVISCQIISNKKGLKYD